MNDTLTNDRQQGQKIEEKQQQLDDMQLQLNEMQQLLDGVAKQYHSSLFSTQITLDAQGIADAILKRSTEVLSQIAEAGLKLAEFYKSDTFKELQETVSGFEDFAQDIVMEHGKTEDFSFLSDFIDNAADLLPHIREELTAYKKKTGKDNLTFTELIQREHDPETGEIAPSILDRAIAKASLPHFYTAPRRSTAYYPVDKFNWTVWHGNPAGKEIAIKMESNDKRLNKTGEQLTGRFKCSIELTEDHFDVFLKLCNLYLQWEANATTEEKEKGFSTTPAQICRALGEPNPGAAQLQKAERLVTEMLGAVISMDNSEWAKATGKTEYRKEIFQLIKGEIKDNISFFNWKETKCRIEVDELPRLFQYAKDVDQITIFTTKALNPPVNKTATTGIYEHYLLDKIAHCRRRANKNKSKKSTFSFKWETLFEYAGVTDKRAKARAKGYIQKFLDHYQKCGDIESYKISGNTGTSTVTVICKGKEQT